jgi:hypothetical protein
MRAISNFITSDWVSAGIVIFLLYWVGGLMVRNRPELFARGQRLAGLVFIVCVLMEGIDTGATEAATWVSIVVHGVFAAGLTLGVSWIALTVVDQAYRLTLGPLVSWVRSRRAALQRRSAQRRRERDERCRLKRERTAYQRSAPERERARFQAEQDARTRGDAQRRRVAARKQALLAYSLYSPALGNRFPRATFDQYVAEYMGDGLAPEDVERSGLDLVAMLEKQVRPPAPDTTIESLSVWYAENLKRLDNLPLDDRFKKSVTVDLKRQFDDRIRRLIQEQVP